MGTQVYFKDIQKIIIGHLQGAKHSIFIALAYFTDREIFDVLCEKADEGVSVHLIIANDETNFKNGLPFDKLRQENCFVYFSESSHAMSMMHNKFCIIDSKIVLTGSYNWSFNAQRNRENLNVIDDIEVVQEYIVEFIDLKQESVVKDFNAKSFNIDSGFPELDNSGGFHSGNLIVIAGVQSIGKTTLALSIIRNVSIGSGIPTAYLTLDQKNQTIINRIMSAEADIDSNKLKAGVLAEYEWATLHTQLDKIMKSQITISELDMPVKLTTSCRSKLTTYFAGEESKFKHCLGSLSNL